MKLQNLLKSIDAVHIEYEYQPVNYQPVHPTIRSSSKRTFLGDNSCRSNTLGADNDDTVKMLCYDWKG